MKAGLPHLGRARQDSSAPRCAIEQAAEKVDEVAALRLVVEGTVSQTGADFFRALVQNLARALGTAGRG